MNETTVAEVRRVLAEQGRLAVSADDLALDDSLYDAGMTSHASVNVMLALEDAFDTEFPDRLLTRNVFESIRSISTAITQMQEEEAAV
jgi:acyl carrier protein